MFLIDNPQEYPFGIVPQDGREYASVLSACSECREAGQVQAGHSQCWLQDIPEGWQAESAPILANGWQQLISRKSGKDRGDAQQ